jgi:hypothetical protein
LIVNVGGGRRGAPNAWELTPRGEHMEHVVRQQAEESERPLAPEATRPR